MSASVKTFTVGESLSALWAQFNRQTDVQLPVTVEPENVEKTSLLEALATTAEDLLEQVSSGFFGTLARNFVFPMLPSSAVPKSGKSRGRRRGRNREVHVETGSLELVQLSTPGTANAFLGGRVPLIPTVIPASRLAHLALLYGQYQIEMSRVTFTSTTTTSTSGRICQAWAFDTLDPTPTSNATIIQMARSSTRHLWQNSSSGMPRRGPEKRRFPVVDPAIYAALSTVDQQIYTPATLFYGLDMSQQTGLLVGSLIWHYKIRFFNAYLVNSSGVASSVMEMMAANVHSPGPKARPSLSFVDVEEEDSDEEVHPSDELASHLPTPSK